MSNWGYVAVAFTVVWGSLAVYAVLLARRVTQAEIVARALDGQGEDVVPEAAQDPDKCEDPLSP